MGKSPWVLLEIMFLKLSTTHTGSPLTVYCAGVSSLVSHVYFDGPKLGAAYEIFETVRS